MKPPPFFGLASFRHSLGSLILLELWALPAYADISGTVVDVNDGSPLVGALVSLQASEVSSVTNAQGEFILPANGETDLVIVGAMKGFFNQAATVSDPVADLVLPLEAVPLEHNPDYVFLNPTETCGGCHSAQLNAWTDTPMARAGRNSWVADIYDGTGTSYGAEGFVYLNDSRHAEDNPASECAACHQPEAWVGAPYSALLPIDSDAPSVAHGISCEVCHKMANVDDAKPNFPGIHPAAVTMTLPNDPAWAIQYGALGDSNYFEAGTMRASYQPQLRAAVCGTCHQDKNDHDGDGDFEDEGGIISEPTYVEWLESPYADPSSEHHADCVDCHMPPTGAGAACDQRPNMKRPDGDVRSHRILGTTPEFLENAVTLGLQARIVNDTLRINVTITNDQVGHHVPTGVTIRNMILLVEATHADGSKLSFTGDQVVHDLGGVGDPNEGYYAGLPGKLYAKINEDAEGNAPTFFTDAVAIKSDNRIPALGVDRTTYSFESTQGGIVDVRARVIYRRSWRSLVDAKQWTTDGHDNPLEDVLAPHFGHLMEEATARIEVPQAPECDAPPCTDPGGPGDGGAGGDDPIEEAAAPVDDEGGCSCRQGAPATPRAPWFPLLFIVGASMTRYRRRIIPA